MSLEEILSSPKEFIQSVFTENELTLFTLIINDLKYENIESYFNDLIHSNDLIFKDFDNYHKTPLEKRIDRFKYEKKKLLNFPKILSFKPFKLNRYYLPLVTRRGRFERYYWTLYNKLIKAFLTAKFMDPSISMESLIDSIELEKGFAKFLRNFNIDHSGMVNHLEMLYAKKKFQSVEIIETPSLDENIEDQDIKLEFEPLIEKKIVKPTYIRLGKNSNLIQPILNSIYERNFTDDIEDLYSVFDLNTPPKNRRIIWNGTLISLTLFFDLLVQYKVIASEEYTLIPDHLDTIFYYFTDNGQIEKVKKKSVQGARERLPNVITSESVNSSITNKLIFDLVSHHINNYKIDL